MMKSKTVSVLAALLMSAASLGHAHAQTKAGDWPVVGGNQGFNRYSALNSINRGNARDLKILWTRPAVDPVLLAKYPDIEPSRYFRSTAVVVDGVAYVPNGIGLAEAFDAATGKTIWTQQPFSDAFIELAGGPGRGVALWKGGGKLNVFNARENYLYRLDAKDGRPVASFGQGGRIDLRRAPEEPFTVSGAPLVVGNLVIVGGAGGGNNDYGFETKALGESVRAYDATTGRLVWEFDPVPAKGDPARQTWGDGSADIAGFMGSYGQMSADEELGYVYVPFSAAGPPMYGGWRPGDNLYGTAVVAIDVKTGKKVWHYQTIRHDVWDYDLGSPPVLGDITVDGRKIKAIMQTGKMPYLYVLDRVTGKPVWPIVETRVPASDVPGEILSPTQPIPSRPEALDRVGVTDDDLIDFTPALKAKAREIVAQYRIGPAFTPPSVKIPGKRLGSIVLPGSDGGANWGTGAFDPETQLYFASTATAPSAYALVKNEKKGTPTEMDYHAELAEDNLTIGGPEGLSLVKPPYGRVTAIDLHDGSKRWMAVNGDGPRDHPALKHLDLPPLGLAGRSAVAITKEVVFMPETSDAVWLIDKLHGGGNMFRVLDKATGKELAKVQMPGGATGAPVTYSAKGKQFVLIATGDSKSEPQWVAMGL